MKNILLIGGSYGIGHAIVSHEKKDHKVYIASRTIGNIEDPNVKYIPFDAKSDELDLSKLPETLDGFVYCPGSINLKPFTLLGIDAFKEEMQINFFSMVNILHKIIPILNNGASLVFLSTVAVRTGMPYHTSIAAAKGAIEGFAKSMAAEYAPKLRVNVIAPSLTDTTLASRLLNNERKREMMAMRHPLKAIGSVDDIANMAHFLLSDKSKWITGQIMGVDGGMSTLNIN